MKSLAALTARYTVSLVARDFSSIEKSALEELAHLKIPGAAALPPGSTTKTFTAAALVELAVEGKIDVNAPSVAM
jgi:hypothetical protein